MHELEQREVIDNIIALSTSAIYDLYEATTPEKLLID
jgi:hypothetical protein